jgi:hypothetical protein
MFCILQTPLSEVSFNLGVKFFFEEEVGWLLSKEDRLFYEGASRQYAQHSQTDAKANKLCLLTMGRSCAATR